MHSVLYCRRSLHDVATMILPRYCFFNAAYKENVYAV
jgi:hypothetical protein